MQALSFRQLCKVGLALKVSFGNDARTETPLRSPSLSVNERFLFQLAYLNPDEALASSTASGGTTPKTISPSCSLPMERSRICP